MNDFSLESLLLAGFVVLFVLVFTVWFGGWVDSNIDEALSVGHKKDEHEENPGI